MSKDKAPKRDLQGLLGYLSEDQQDVLTDALRVVLRLEEADVHASWVWNFWATLAAARRMEELRRDYPEEYGHRKKGARIERAAGELGMSPSTLRRRLSAGGSDGE